MLLRDTAVDPSELARSTGWEVKPQGACKGDVCVPLPGDVRNADGTIDVVAFADRLGMPLVADAEHGLWALGPAFGVTGRALTTAVAPELELPTLDGEPFRLSSLRGQKVVIVSWAPW
jgi:hypothetical protein